jgi:hypothetical protein
MLDSDMNSIEFRSVSAVIVLPDKSNQTLKMPSGNRDLNQLVMYWPGVSERAVATEFRRQYPMLENCSEKTSGIALDALICSFVLCESGVCIYLGQNIQTQYRPANGYSGVSSLKQPDIQIFAKNPSRWRQTRLLNWQVEFSIRLDQHAENDKGILNGFCTN